MDDRIRVLRALDLGNIVAEYDRLLSQCFILRPVLTDIIDDRKDIVLGAKGAGKSALWKEMQASKEKYPQLADVELRLITNPAGDPEFRDVIKAIEANDFPDIDELRVGWRLYLLAQFWRASR